MRKLAIWLVVLLSAAGGGWWLWQRHKETEIAGASIQSTYLDRSPQTAKGRNDCVVFVHGIFGADSSWGSDQSALPRLLADDPELSGRVDVFLFEYSTPWLRNANRIPDLAEQLRGALDDNDVWSHDKVIFVAHSMGGLIVRQYLSVHREHVSQVPMMYFYAVPTNGAPVTAVAQKISDNPQLRGMLPLEGNDFLDSLTYSWLADDKLKNLTTSCAFESDDTYGIRIVPQESAIALCSSVDPLTADHITIVKPRDAHDPKFTRLDTNIRNSLRQASIPHPEIPNGQDSGSTPSLPIKGNTRPPEVPPGSQQGSQKQPDLDDRWAAVRTSQVSGEGRTLNLMLALIGARVPGKLYGTIDYSEIGSSTCSAHYNVSITATNDPRVVHVTYDHKTVTFGSEEGCLTPLPNSGAGTLSTEDFVQVTFHGDPFLERVGSLQ
jgi:pimeloyl-ACP methyl ester carboxylesterase